MDDGLTSRTRNGFRPEGGMGCGPDKAGLVVDSDGFLPLGSGSGAHVSMGRWSDGSISFPS